MCGGTSEEGNKKETLKGGAVPDPHPQRDRREEAFLGKLPESVGSQQGEASQKKRKRVRKTQPKAYKIEQTGVTKQAGP